MDQLPNEPIQPVGVKLDHHQRRMVVFLISLVGEVIDWESLRSWHVCHPFFECLLVGGVAALAINKDLLFVRQSIEMLLERFGPVIFPKVLVGDWDRIPAPDLVEFQEDAGFDGLTS